MHALKEIGLSGSIPNLIFGRIFQAFLVFLVFPHSDALRVAPDARTGAARGRAAGHGLSRGERSSERSTRGGSESKAPPIVWSLFSEAEDLGWVVVCVKNFSIIQDPQIVPGS